MSVKETVNQDCVKIKRRILQNNYHEQLRLEPAAEAFNLNLVRYVEWQFNWGNDLVAIDVSLLCGNWCSGVRCQWQSRQEAQPALLPGNQVWQQISYVQLAILTIWPRQCAYDLFCSGNSSWGNRPLQHSWGARADYPHPHPGVAMKLNCINLVLWNLVVFMSSNCLIHCIAQVLGWQHGA